MHTLTKGLSVRLHLSLKHTHLRNPVYQSLIFRHLFSTRPRWSVKASLPTAHSNSSLAPRLGPIGFFPVLEYSDEQLWWGSELGFSFLFACMDTSHLDSSMTVLYPVFVLVPFVTDEKMIFYWWFKWFLREAYSHSPACCMHILLDRTSIFIMQFFFSKRNRHELCRSYINTEEKRCTPRRI